MSYLFKVNFDGGSYAIIEWLSDREYSEQGAKMRLRELLKEYSEVQGEFEQYKVEDFFETHNVRIHVRFAEPVKYPGGR